jgi:hypothetical protein
VTWLVGRTYEADAKPTSARCGEPVCVSMVVVRVLGEGRDRAHAVGIAAARPSARAASPAELARFRQLASLALQGLQGWVELR